MRGTQNFQSPQDRLIARRISICALSTLGLLPALPAQAADGTPPPVDTATPASTQRSRHALTVLVRLDGGQVFMPNLKPGAFARFGAEALFAPKLHGFSPIYGLWNGFEGWGAPRGSGFSVPIVGYGGIRAWVLIATLGGGLNLITVDGLDGKKGVGIFSPRASARVGFVIGPIHIAAEADVQRRWRWGLDDQTLFQAGVTLGPVLQRDPLR